MKNLKAIILAAGEGTRMKSKKAKVLHEIFGKTMVMYVTDAAKECGASEVCVVVGHNADEVKESLKDAGVSFRLQEKQLGTGHAVMQAEDVFSDDDNVLILYGDTPLVTAETLKKLIKFHNDENNGVTLVSAILENPTGYGRIIRDKDGNFVKNVEHKDATDEERLVKEVNTGIYCFDGKSLKYALNKLTNNNAQGEYYLPDCLEIILNSGKNVNSFIIDDASEFYGVNSRVQLAEATKIMQNRINTNLMTQGVTIVDPSNTYISAGVKVGMDTVIMPGTVIEGNSEIGENCTIGVNCHIVNSIIGNNTSVVSSVLTDAKVGNNTTVGPFAYLRPKSNIGDNARIGDFVEIKNSNIGNGTKVSHLTYIGDSDVGEKINFGCGTVTVNYDGKAKYRTTIEDGAFIGCNVNLVAPVTVKKNAYIAAGSTITHEVPENALAIARERQTNKEDWVTRKNLKRS